MQASRSPTWAFAAGVPLVEALDSVGGASGNSVYAMATDRIQQEVSTGTSLTAAMGNANVFPSMVLQMCAIGEESGSIDHMLSKAADFYEAEVDEMVAGLSSLMEPIIIVVLGYALCKLGYMGDKFDQKLSSIVIDVTCPAIDSDDACRIEIAVAWPSTCPSSAATSASSPRRASPTRRSAS